MIRMMFAYNIESLVMSNCYVYATYVFAKIMKKYSVL